MNGNYDYSLPPSVRRISNAFRIAGWVSFCMQAALAVVSGLILLFAVIRLSARADNSAPNPGTNVGLFLAVLGVVSLFLGAYWAFRYILLGRRLKSSDAASRPKPKDAIQTIRYGLIISLAGMFLSLLAAEAIVGSLIGKIVLQPTNLTYYNPGNVGYSVQPLDIIIVQANTNVIAAHFVAIIASLWLSNTVNRQ